MLEKQFADIGNGLKVAYLSRAGRGTPLVLLHGITETARSFESLLDQLPAHCDVYALDLRGHGDSSKPDELYATPAYAADIIAFIEQVIKKPVLLAGHSLGGAVSVQVAASAPKLTRAIFLEDPPLYFVNGLDEIYQAAFEGLLLIATTLQNGSRTHDDWFKVMAAAPDPYSGLPGIETTGETKINQRLAALSQLNPKALEDGLAGANAWDTDKQLQSIECGTTLLTGNAAIGSVMTLAETRQAIAQLKECTHHYYENVGHLIHDQLPEEWLEAMRTFCSEH